MNILKKLYIKFFVGGSYAGATNANLLQLFELKASELREKTLHSTESGITHDRICEQEIIVTLTTYGKRIFDVYLAIESIMQGSQKPNRIILWLDEGMKDRKLPITLQRQLKRGLQIEYTQDIRSYKKLVPTLLKYPDAVCITIDDDLIYSFDLIENLTNAYNENPRHIYAARVHTIKTGVDGLPLEYSKWPFGQGQQYPTKLNFPTGCGGILYPPDSLHPEVVNADIFMSLAPKADDVWFYAMALANGYTSCRIATRSNNGEEYIQNEAMQTEALNHSNVTNGGNDVQIKAVFTKYGIYDIIKNPEIS